MKKFFLHNALASVPVNIFLFLNFFVKGTSKIVKQFMFVADFDLQNPPFLPFAGFILITPSVMTTEVASTLKLLPYQSNSKNKLKCRASFLFLFKGTPSLEKHNIYLASSVPLRPSQLVGFVKFVKKLYHSVG
jgi:hypothetical protein